MKTSGISKLRFAVTLLFIFYVIMVVGIFIASDVEYRAEKKFIDSLTDSEINTIIGLYEDLEDSYVDYPETNVDEIYNITGWLYYIIGGGLFVLMIKVHTVSVITDVGEEEVNLMTLRRDIVGKTTEDAQCPDCGCVFPFEYNVGMKSYIQCPFCETEGIYEEDWYVKSIKRRRYTKNKTTVPRAVCSKCGANVDYFRMGFGKTYTRCRQCGYDGYITETDNGEMLV